MKTKRSTLLLLVHTALAAALPVTVFAEESRFGQAASDARAELDAALHELSEVREAIADERIPLVRRQREWETQAAEKRRELARLEGLRDNRQVRLDSLQNEVSRLEDQHNYVQGLLAEYLRQLESDLPVSEMNQLAPVLREARERPADGQAPTLLPELEAVQLSVDRLRQQIGGRGYEGDAVGRESVVETGRFLEVGPVILFAGPSFAGLAEERIGSLTAHIAVSSQILPEAIREVVETGSGTLPFDPTLGDATRRDQARTTFWERVQQGGIVMVPILGLALAALIVALLKWIQIAGMRETEPGTLQAILASLANGEKEAAARRAASVHGPVGELLRTAVDNAHERKELIEEILYEKILQAQPRLERYLPFIALTAATAPLLGLLGTVTGMINTFQLITLFGTGDARTLSGGISEALITTQFGLAVAIVALLIHALLSRKAKGVIANMEQTEAAFLNGLPENRGRSNG